MTNSASGRTVSVGHALACVELVVTVNLRLLSNTRECLFACRLLYVNLVSSVIGVERGTAPGVLVVDECQN